MDVVYYVRQGDRNEELRYSLRSLVNFPHERVWIFGHKPRWVDHVLHVPGNRSGGAQSNAISNLRLACEYVGADRFAIFNDDFFVMDPVLAVPSYHAGPLRDRLRGVFGAFATHLRIARDQLLERGYPDPIAWTLHIPVVVWRAELASVLASIPSGIPPEWRTMYGNLSGAVGEQAPDVKVRKRSDPLPEGPFLSCSDATFPAVRRVLEARFPRPSRYEVPA